jgi:hypothetical protein
LTGNWYWFEREALCGDVFLKLVPLSVEEDASEMEQALGAPSAPAHARAVEAHADQVLRAVATRDGQGEKHLEASS